MLEARTSSSVAKGRDADSLAPLARRTRGTPTDVGRSGPIGIKLAVANAGRATPVGISTVRCFLVVLGLLALLLIKVVLAASTGRRRTGANLIPFYSLSVDSGQSYEHRATEK